jgi:TRAP-type mannitol/chloroaromatic compound transport system permease small subunit
MASMQELTTGIAGIDAASRLIERLTALVSVLGTVLILGIMLLIAADVFGRAALGNPIAGVPEIVAMSILAIVFLQIANTTALGKLTRSDAFLGLLRRRSPRLAEGLDAVLHAAGAVLLAVLISAFYPHFLRSYGRGEMVGTVGQFLAPIWPVHGIVLFGAGLMFLVFAARALALAIRAFRGFPRGGRT